MRRITPVLLMMLTLCSFAAHALSPEQVPKPLQPWVSWVLAGEEQRQCPFIYNQTDGQQCAWPTQLNLDLTDRGGKFSQQWQLYSDSWVSLPGDSQHWPQQVTVNGQPQPVTVRNGRPSVKLTAGSQLIRGQWQWSALPTSLLLPPASALLALTINEQAKTAPEIDAKGQLWLAKSQSEQTQVTPSDALTLQVFRKISDLNPLQVTNQFILEVTGEQRELVLGPVLLDQQIPLQLDSPLPAKIEPDGRLTVQVRPGRWIINLLSRQPGAVQELSLPTLNAPWPEQEVWVFEAAPHLRLVEIANLTSIDPQQTNLPSDWQRLPAYSISQGESMQLREIRRGNPDPQPNQLQLKRQLWLDFDGRGYSVQDQLTGQINQGWRLEASPALELGQVSLNGTPQFITQQADSELKGVEIRQGQLQLTADSRYNGAINQLPAVGWNTDLAGLQTRLYLPPGWSLFSASGMDKAPNTWLSSWTLLDLFLVLIAALAALRLWGWSWGLITLVTLTLIWHEHSGFGPPRWIWLNLMAATALLKVLPAGLLRKTLIGYRAVCLVILLLIALPFMAEQVRLAMYPQLSEVQYYQPNTEFDEQAFSQDYETSAQMDEVQADEYSSLKSLGRPIASAPIASKTLTPARALHQADPNAKLQTGPGLPQWHANSIDMRWNGPVNEAQNINLILISPTTNWVLSLLRVLLISLLMLRMAGVNFNRKRGFYQEQRLWSATLPAALLPLLTVMSLVGMLMPSPAYAELPNQAMLDELKTRLLAPADCLPACAQIAHLQLTLPEPSTANDAPLRQPLHMELAVHTQAPVAVPLPGARNHWQLNSVLIDGQPASALRRDESGILYLSLPPGIHQVQLQGELSADQLQLDLPLLPNQVQVTANGWTVGGLNDNGVPNSQLQLSRTQAAGSTAPSAPLTSGPQPDFVQVTRTLQLGLDWQLDTQVSRVSPLGQPITLSLPLLAGESLLTDGLTVKDGKVQLTLQAEQSEAHWQSRLAKSDQITLTAADTTRWSEVWRLDSSAIWHVSSSGLVESLPHEDQDGASDTWLPIWHPWPGESLNLAISRPAGVAGQTLTIDSSQLNVAPGRQAMDVALTLQLRSSQGGQHRIGLPESIELQSVVIDGKSQALRLQADSSLLLPLTPGAQQVQINWRQASGIASTFSTPNINLNSASVNNDIQLTLGDDRWVLWTSGPVMGPAVLFWSLLLVIALLAFALSRVRFTPLRFQHWLLLGIGLSQLPLWMAGVVAAWLLALGLRGRMQQQSASLFNVLQVGLVLLTLFALSFLFLAIQQGLLGLPNMQISGHGSYGNILRWYQDRSHEYLPQGWVLSVPLWVYRGLMLCWALWLAFALLGWLRWGWRCFAYQGLWRSVNFQLGFAAKPKAATAELKEKAKPDPDQPRSF